jgi:hypothetical protein
VKGDGHSGDMVDGANKDWDFKRPRSRAELISDIQREAVAKGRKPPSFAPGKVVEGEFELTTTLDAIRREIAAAENVIIDTSKLNAADLAALEQAIKGSPLEPHIIFYP